jgi:hypothetical protein
MAACRAGVGSPGAPWAVNWDLVAQRSPIFFGDWRQRGTIFKFESVAACVPPVFSGPGGCGQLCGRCVAHLAARATDMDGGGLQKHSGLDIEGAKQRGYLNSIGRGVRASSNQRVWGIGVALCALRRSLSRPRY